MKLDLDEMEASLGFMADWKLLIEEVRHLREVVQAARPLIRGLELVQELGEPTEKGWRKELKLQQALSQLDEARRG
jgi:hypothetical protein